MLVAEKLTVPVARTWFVDERTPVRRMQVTRHPDRGLVVLSLWQGGHCTGTFRLRLNDAPALVHTLVDGMAAELPNGMAAELPNGMAAELPDGPPAGPRGSWLERVRARLVRGGSNVVNLFDPPS